MVSRRRGTTQLFGEPAAAKVPEITVAFWVIKLFTTAGGEAASDYLALGSHVAGGAVEAGLLVIGLAWQYSIRALWAVVLAAVFWLWYRSEGTLSIHSITTRRRECFYWVTVFATFALGTALGDFTATTAGLGYLSSVVLFAVIILIPAVAWWRLRMSAIFAFWFAYVITRPLGASVADYIGKPQSVGGAGFGEGPTAVVMTIAVAAGAGYLAVTRGGIQQPATRGERADPARLN